MRSPRVVLFLHLLHYFLGSATRRLSGSVHLQPRRQAHGERLEFTYIHVNNVGTSFANLGV